MASGWVGTCHEPKGPTVEENPGFKQISKHREILKTMSYRTYNVRLSRLRRTEHMSLVPIYSSLKEGGGQANIPFFLSFSSQI